MNYEDFIRPAAEPVEQTENVVEETMEETVEPSVELDVQKAVVESLAADKAEQNVQIEKLCEETAALKKENNVLTSKIADLSATIEEMRTQLIKVGDILAKNTELPKSNQVTLLERNPEVEDRFEGETRDQILEVLKEARDASEADGRARRAQLIESVLVANEPTGNLAKKRLQLEKIFNDNQNVINGQVINELDKLNITYKLGEKYLLVGEIIKRAY